MPIKITTTRLHIVEMDQETALLLLAKLNRRDLPVELQLLYDSLAMATRAVPYPVEVGT